MALPLRYLALSALSLALIPAIAPAQLPNASNLRGVEPAPNVQDKADIWTMNLELKDPRMLVVDVPGRGKKVVWYMWYRLINRTEKEHTVIPNFELVLSGKFSLNYEVLPSVHDAIRK